MVEQNLFSPPGEGLYIPDHVRCLLHEGGAVIVDYEEGRTKELYEAGSHVLQAVNEQGSIAALASYLEAKAHLSPERASSAATNWVNTLMDHGFILQNDSGQPLPRKLPVVATLAEEAPPRVDTARFTWEEIEDLNLDFEERQIAVESLAQTFRLLADESFTLGMQLRRLSQLHSSKHRLATEEELLRTIASIHYVSRERMDRVACLEVTVAAFIANARLGRQAVLSFGARVDPVAFHAWLTSIDGRPIRLPFDEIIERVYYPLYRIGPSDSAYYEPEPTTP